MKVALVILHADPARGGAERYTTDLAAALARGGHDVSLLATSFADVPAGVTCVALDPRGVTRAGRYNSFLDALDRHLDATHYDVVHAMLPVRRCDVYHPHAGLAVAAVEDGSRVSTLFNPRRTRFAEVERTLLTSARPPIVLALSEYVKRAIRRHYSLDDARLPVLFNAVDLDRFQPVPKPRRETVNALFVGQDFQRKGLPETLLALSSLKGSPLRLTVVGRRDGKLHWPPQAGVDVTFAGETKDPRPFYRDADFFVLPTKHDPCSLVVLEALASGLPVISTRFNGACEVMTDGVHGFVLEDPTDVGALADAMRKMLDSELRARMSEACLALRPRLSYENHLDRLTEIYSCVGTAKSDPNVEIRNKFESRMKQ